jgi:hypothetical protein
MIARTSVLSWIDRGVATCGALTPEPASSAFIERARHWARQMQSRIRRLERASAPYVVVSGGGVRLPMLYLEIDASIRLDSYEEELGRVMGTLGDRIVLDEETRTWSVGVSSADGWPSELAWGLAQGTRPVLVVGWSRGAVVEARRRLEE